MMTAFCQCTDCFTNNSTVYPMSLVKTNFYNLKTFYCILLLILLFINNGNEKIIHSNDDSGHYNK